ncbi:MAG: GlyGly-CTERM sorting domain-containing protein, partial [Moraxellaceae bacterium]
MFLFLPFVIFIVIEYSSTGKIMQSVKHGMIIPFIYSFYVMYNIFVAIRRKLKEDGQKPAYSLAHETHYYDSFSYKVLDKELLESNEAEVKLTNTATTTDDTRGESGSSSGGGGGSNGGGSLGIAGILSLFGLALWRRKISS